MHPVFPVPTPRPRESRDSYKNRAFAAQLEAQLALKGQPVAYQQFCTALKAEWAAFKVRPKSRFSR